MEREKWAAEYLRGKCFCEKRLPSLGFLRFPMPWAFVSQGPLVLGNPLVPLGVKNGQKCGEKPAEMLGKPAFEPGMPFTCKPELKGAWMGLE